jgi:NADP-dependent 3-hydroxy acid dehydrogenase YdfG
LLLQVGSLTPSKDVLCKFCPSFKQLQGRLCPRPVLAQFVPKLLHITYRSSGAASGIAKATAKLLHDRGASLSLADLNGDQLEAVAAELQACSKTSQQKVTATALDVRKSDQVTLWIEQTVKDHGRLDGACNLAGVVTSDYLLGDTTDDNFNFVMGVNVTGM